jgi:hypothetical protein
MSNEVRITSFGNPSTFGINCCITDLFESISMRAYGCFYYHINGTTYGVTRPEATFLVHSYDQAVESLAHRGSNRCPILAAADLPTVVEMHRTCFWPAEAGPHWRGVPIDAVMREVVESGMILAPDGDAAFDDSGRIYMLDRADGDVELFAFKQQCEPEPFSDQTSLRIPSDVFYDTLEAFATWFEKQTGFVRASYSPVRRRTPWAGW